MEASAARAAAAAGALAAAGRVGLGVLAWALAGRLPRLGRWLGLQSALLTGLVCTPWAGHQLQQRLTRLPRLVPAQISALAGVPHTAMWCWAPGAGR